MNQFVHMQNLLGHVTARNKNEIRAMELAMEELGKLIHFLAESQPQLVQLSLEDQMSGFEERVDTMTSAIKSLHERKLALDYLSNDQMVKLYNSINETATADGFTLLPKQVSDLFQIETSYPRQNNDIVIILHVPCINAQELMTIYRDLSFPIPLPQAISNHDMNFRQSIEIEQLS
jgi:hypothetical protein